jgi:hypothetical protein
MFYFTLSQQQHEKLANAGSNPALRKRMVQNADLKTTVTFRSPQAKADFDFYKK